MNGAYSVDEVSSLLGIPRPTLYRYLKEYSIPNLRKSGRISIPEDSVEKIRRVRDLHREGMGTGSVRRMMSEPAVASRTDEVEITSRLDRISEELEGVRVEGRPAAENFTSDQAIRTLLARQTVLISAVIGLTEMVEDMMRMNGQPSRKRYTDSSPDLRGYAPRDTSREVHLSGGRRASARSERKMSERKRGSVGARRSVISSARRSGASLAVRLPARSRTPESAVSSTGTGSSAASRSGRDRRQNRGEGRTFRSSYGSLARRRRRTTLLGVLLLGVLAVVVAALFFGLP